MKCVYSCVRAGAPAVGGWWWGGGVRRGSLTVQGDPDLRVVVPVGNLPDIEGFGGRVGQQAEEEDDGVGRGKTFRVDLPGKRQEHNVHGRESDLVYRPGAESPDCRPVRERQSSRPSLQKLPAR